MSGGDGNRVLAQFLFVALIVGVLMLAILLM